jgi:CheY-like chemotaxis protein
MDSIVPFLGAALLILVSVAGIIILSRYGLRLRRFKHDNLELLFQQDQESNSVPPNESFSVLITHDSVSFGDRATSDCERLTLNSDSIIAFIVEEAERHPVMFESSFSSLSLIFSGYLLFLSWNGSIVSVERVISRIEAYPLNDAWNQCLSLYRQATLLPYREVGSVKFKYTPELKRSISHFRALSSRMEGFLSLVQNQKPEAGQRSQELIALSREIDFATDAGDHSSVVVRMEAMLSSVHKLLINYAPDNLDHGNLFTTSVAKRVHTDSGKPTVLLVDDDFDISQILAKVLEKEGFDVLTVNDTRDAKLFLIEKYFDIVMTDFVMEHCNGLEIAFTAKAADSNTSVIIYSHYGRNLSEMDKGQDKPWDKYLVMPKYFDELVAVVRKILEEKQKTLSK